MTYFLLRDYSLLLKKELHSSLWVGMSLNIRIQARVHEGPYKNQYLPPFLGGGALYRPFRKSVLIM